MIAPPCPRCGSAGEHIGGTEVPDGRIYHQYRCTRCGHGYMLQPQEVST